MAIDLTKGRNNVVYINRPEPKFKTTKIYGYNGHVRPEVHSRPSITKKIRKKKENIIMPFLLILLLIGLIIIGPLLTIWALNVLFPVLAIPYTIETWFAVALLGMAIRGNVSVNK